MLAKAAGTSRQNIYEIEKDISTTIRTERAKKYAHVLGVSCEYLLTGFEPTVTLQPIDVVLRQDGQLDETDIALITEYIETRRRAHLVKHLLARQEGTTTPRSSDDRIEGLG